MKKALVLVISISLLSYALPAQAALTIGANNITPDSGLIINGTGNVGIGAASIGGKLEVKVDAAQTVPLSLRTNDFSLGSAGSSLDYNLGAATGNTYMNVQMYNSGGNAAGNLVMQALGGNVGIGTTSPTYTLDVSKSSGSGSLRVQGDSGVFDLYGNNSTSGVSVYSYRNSSVTHSYVQGLASRGTLSSPLGIQSGDSLIRVQSYGYDGSGFVNFSGDSSASIDFVADENFTDSSHHATKILFATLPSLGNFRQTRMIIASGGNVGIGTSVTPVARFELKDGHYASTQTTAPTASVTGTGYSGASIGANSTDTKGTVTATVGANAGTLVVTFNIAYATAPVCTVTPATATAQVDTTKLYATATTGALTLNFVATPTGGSETFNYICLQ